jgi:hypothetical protein
LTLPLGFSDAWPFLPAVTGADVFRGVLEHERLTRSEIREATQTIDLTSLEAEQLLALVSATSRYSLGKSIMTGFRTWKLWSSSTTQLLDVAISRDIHYRGDLAPLTGSLREAGQTLARMQEPNEFTEVYRSWSRGEVELSGLTAVWVDSDELGLVEGCHRLIPLSSMIQQGETPLEHTTLTLALGKP